MRKGQGGPQGEWKLNFERRGRPATTPEDREGIRGWLIGSLVDGWFEGDVEVIVDDYEILVVGTLSNVELPAGDVGARAVAETARIERFRNDTRERRITIAEGAESRFGRKVAWGATVGETTRLFTTTSVPVMTRLHLRQRQTLDTLVDSGVARSRSEALAWCVELVGRNETAWISRLREALDAVERARGEGPGSTPD
ncbi:MAG TPA: hypothetical protein VNF07_08870 [Acidimicrobiales bacterium]|nr:hypothetical protein [Acidimicrobiales bacterium]